MGTARGNLRSLYGTSRRSRRSIGACYTYISEEKPVPAGLNERILQATLGTVTPQEIKAPWRARVASRFRLLLDPIMSPQLATVATMLLVAILVLTNTVSADGSISGVYDAGLQLAERTGQSRSIADYPLEIIGEKNKDRRRLPHKSREQISRRTHPATNRMRTARTIGEELVFKT